MASPQSPSPADVLSNSPAPVGSPELHAEAAKLDIQSVQDVDMANTASSESPMVSKPLQPADKENTSPTKTRHSRILSGAELSPLKLLSSIDDNSRTEGRSPERIPSNGRSPRRPSPDKRFPVRVNTPTELPPSSSPVLTPVLTPVLASVAPPVQNTHIVTEQDVTLEEALKQNKDLAKAIKIFEDEDSEMMDSAEDHHNAFGLSPERGAQDDDDEAAGADDTMVSTFSTFSAVPNMTMFARLGQTPSKFPKLDSTITGSTRKRNDLSPSRRPPILNESGNTTNLLMDFTDQMAGFSNKQSPMRRTNTTGNMQNGSTPIRRQSNLLDFDLPPLPTPRSMPSITPRELESLKSAFLSEISSLKASLSGKEAEVLSLKTAVGDAEKRVGESLEQLREAEGARDSLREEKDNWECRGREMEKVLRQVKDEIVKNQQDVESLESRLVESEQRREAAENMAQVAESKMAGMQAGKACLDAQKSPEKKTLEKSRAEEIQEAVEKAGLELHGLYKAKHESKVTALKKSYEKKWEKKVRELEHKLAELEEDNEKLKLSRNATTAKFDPNMSVIDEERREQSIKDSAHIKEMRAEIENLKAIIKSVKTDNAELIVLLERERVEKGELVQLAEEMMQMQSMQSFLQREENVKPAAPASPPKRHSQPPSSPNKPKTPAPPGSVRQSLASAPRSSGLKAPGSMRRPVESRIGGPGHERNRIGGSFGRPAGGLGARSGIMNSIEKMGSHRGRAD